MSVPIGDVCVYAYDTARLILSTFLYCVCCIHGYHRFVLPHLHLLQDLLNLPRQNTWNTEQDRCSYTGLTENNPACCTGMKNSE